MALMVGEPTVRMPTTSLLSFAQIGETTI